MKHIFTIALFELKKKKVSFSPKALLILTSIFILFISAFGLLALNQTKTVQIYEISATDPLLKEYLNNSAFLIIPHAKTTVIGSENNGYRTIISPEYDSVATQVALVEYVKRFNREKIKSENPSDILFLSPIRILREEILTPPSQFLGQQIPQPQNQSNSSSNQLPNPQEKSNTNAQSADQEPVFQEVIFEEQPQDIQVNGDNDVSSFAEEIISQQIAISDILNTNQEIFIQENASIYSDEELAILEEIAAQEEAERVLVHPQDVSTVQQIKEMFLIIQVMILSNLFAALAGNAFFNEKLNYKSSLLFTTTISKTEFFIGKMLPYFVACFLAICTALFFQYKFLLGNIQTYIIVFATITVYFAISVTNGLLARSNKEFSFLNVFTTSILTLYLLIPAFIANFSTLGYASLVTPLLLLAQLQEVDIAITFFVLSIYLAISFVVFVIASSLFDFEHLYKYDTPLQKLKFLIKTASTKIWTHSIYGACVVPIIWLLQLFLIALFLVVNAPIKVFALLLLAAFSEEIFRNFIVHANPHATDQLKRSFATAVGFTLVEKGLLFVVIAPYLEGFLLIATSGIIVPLALHTGFTYACYKLIKIPYLYRCVILGIIHALINYAIITVFGVVIL